MNLASKPPHGMLVVAARRDHSRLSRQARAGKALRLAPGLYVVDATLPPEQLARHHLHAVISKIWPGAVLCGRTALEGGVPVEGEVYIAHPDPPRRTKLVLPGITIIPIVGPGHLPGDIFLPEGLAISGPARVLIENTALQGRPARFRAENAAVGDRIDELARSGGAGRIRTTIDQLEVVAGSFDKTAVSHVRGLLTAVLGSFSGATPAATGRLAARLAGSPFDSYRVEMVDSLVSVLLNRAPAPIHASPPTTRWEWLAFFESYFSNFIEGTEFGVAEARRIAIEGVIPAARPEDAHDVAATYRLAVDPAERTRTPRSGEDFISLLRDRHRTLMAARPGMHPGQLKSVPNFAGGYQFVEPGLVEGTLLRGFSILDRLQSPLARATSMMALVTECHPFDDGNGRISRLMANAELSVAGEVRIVIPIVYRNNYLAALSGFSNRSGSGESLIAVLEYAQRWAASIDWSTYDGAHKSILACNAYVDPGLAERSNLRLLMPPSV